MQALTHWRVRGGGGPESSQLCVGHLARTHVSGGHRCVYLHSAVSICS